MGQYFKFVNADREEWIELPGPMKLIERLTSQSAMTIVGYMLFDGPGDRTHLTRLPGEMPIDDVEMQQQVDEYIEDEKRRNAGEDRTSVYYDDDEDEWKRRRIQTVVLANYEISELMDYCGRWAGDDVRLVGDYAENGLYGEASTKNRYRRADGTVFTGYSGSGPIINQDPGDMEDGVVKMGRDDIIKGDTVSVQDPSTDERIFATYIGTAEQQWTDITDPMLEEMHQVLGNSWFLDNIAEAYHGREFEEQSAYQF